MITPEKRKRKRKKEENRVTLEVIFENKPLKEENVPCFLVEDISLKGVKILTDRKIPADKLLKLNIELKEMNKSISIYAKVKWTKNIDSGEMFENGLEFVDTSPQDIYKLIGHIYKKNEEPDLLES